MAIKWTDKQLLAFEWALNRVNDGLERSNKAPISEEKLKEIKSSITSQSLLDRFVTLSKYANKPKAFDTIITEKGLQTTQFQIDVLQHQVDIINRRREKQRKQIAPDPYRGTAGELRRRNLQPKVFDINKIKPRDIEKYIKSVEKQSHPDYLKNSLDLYKANYLKAVRTNYPGDTDFYDYINAIPTSDLYDMQKISPVMIINFHYDEIEEELKKNAVREVVEQYYGRDV